MSLLAWARICVAAGLVVLAGRRALPALMLRFKPDSLRCWFLPGDREAGILEGSPALQDCMERLKRLHYFLIGVKVEKLPLWGGTYVEVAMAARDHTAFASIVLQPFGAPASIYFYTPISGGGMVFTRDYAGGRQAEAAGLSVRNVPSEDVDLVHRDHQERVTALRAQGHSLDVTTSQAGRIVATKAFYASAYYRQLAALGDGLASLALGGSLALLLWALLAGDGGG